MRADADADADTDTDTDTDAEGPRVYPMSHAAPVAVFVKVSANVYSLLVECSKANHHCISLLQYELRC